MSLGSFGRNYDEKARQSRFKADLEAALFALKRGEIRRYKFIRGWQDAAGKFWFGFESDVIKRTCYQLGISTEQLDAWRVEYDALPKEPPSEEDDED
jgi:hypothetical protein